MVSIIYMYMYICIHVFTCIHTYISQLLVLYVYVISTTSILFVVIMARSPAATGMLLL